VVTDETEDESGPDPLRKKVDELNPDSLTPREALALLYELKELLQE
jgi:DNA mismatch repair protein MutS